MVSMKTKIEWCDYSLNPVKGLCPVGCSYCYARRMYKRFRWDPTIRYDDWVWQEGGHIPSGSRIFVGSTMELFGPWIDPSWLQIIFDYCRAAPSHTFIFLTKQPEGLVKWSPFPRNVWVGISATNRIQFYRGCDYLTNIEAGVKLISFEPLLESMTGLDPIGTLLKNAGIGWAIIGQQTPASRKTTPDIKWIRHISSQATRCRIPVFMKDNLVPIFREYNRQICNECEAGDPCNACGDMMILKQEFPKVKNNGKN